MERQYIRYVVFLLWLTLELLTCVTKVNSANDYNLGGKLVYAVNAGGSAHVDVYGIFYEADTCQSGIQSDYGRGLLTIERVNPADVVLYQTERYGLATFGYKIPISEDGDYVLVLKFSEVYFLNPRKKIFDVFLNKVHQVVKNLDIFDKVGRGVAHDEIIPFRVKGKGQMLVVNEGTSRIRNKEIDLQFVKGPADNPKVNAFYVIRGVPEDVPQLPPHDPTDADVGQDVFSSEDMYYNIEDLHDHEQLKLEYERSHLDKDLLAQKEKRRQRLIQKPKPREMDMVAYEDENWTGYIQIGGSVAIALTVVLAVRKIISL